jgi:hypothetical protein
VVGRVAEELRHLAAAVRRSKAAGVQGGTVRGTDGGETGETCRQTGPASGPLGHDDFVKQTDRRCIGGVDLSVMNKLVEAFLVPD